MFSTKQSARPRIITVFGSFSLFIIVAYIFFRFGPFPVRDVLDVEQQLHPYQWHEFVRLFLGYSLVPAILGLGVLIANFLGRGSRALLVLTAISGVILAGLSYIGEGLAHIDCGSQCAPYIPAYTTIDVLSVLLLSLWTVGPMLALLMYRRSRK
jgi:hypothetical protein